jgi:hypothetical protein
MVHAHDIKICGIRTYLLSDGDIGAGLYQHRYRCHISLDGSAMQWRQSILVLICTEFDMIAQEGKRTLFVSGSFSFIYMHAYRNYE